MKQLDLCGQRYGRLTVVRKAENASNGKSQWLCRCDCGNKKTVRRTNLLGGSTMSCGCLQKEAGAKNAPLAAAALKTHGMSKTRLNRIFKGIVNRCYNQNSPAYKDYGARGITVCGEWLRSRELFFRWARENGYADHLSIDRIDNNRGYSPDNCRWATNTEQSNNTRRNRVISLDGIEKTLAQWARQYGIPLRTLWARLDSGWSEARAITTPITEKGAKK